MAITTTSNQPTIRLLTGLLALAAYLFAFSSAAATAQRLAATPVDLARRDPLGGGRESGKFNFGSAVQNLKSKPQSASTSGPTNGQSSGSSSASADRNSSREPTCGTGTAVGTMWIADRAYTCVPVDGNNYCVATSLSSYNSRQTLCSKHSDCGSGWCIKVTGGGSACWSSAIGCDDYYHGRGTPI
jgi:hypothetical protein